MAVDLDDVSARPLASACQSCGTARDLAVVALGTPIGVYCLTVCGACVSAAVFPSIGWTTTALMVGVHCGHLGIDLDQMAAALDAEARS